MAAIARPAVCLFVVGVGVGATLTYLSLRYCDFFKKQKLKLIVKKTRELTPLPNCSTGFLSEDKNKLSFSTICSQHVTIHPGALAAMATPIVSASTYLVATPILFRTTLL